MNKIILTIILSVMMVSCATTKEIEKIKYDAKEIARKSIIRRNMEPVILKGDTYYNLIEYVLELQEENKTCSNKLNHIEKLDE